MSREGRWPHEEPPWFHIVCLFLTYVRLVLPHCSLRSFSRARTLHYVARGAYQKVLFVSRIDVMNIRYYLTNDFVVSKHINYLYYILTGYLLEFFEFFF